MNKWEIIIALVTLFIGLNIPTIYNRYFKGPLDEDGQIKVFSPEQLAMYDGIQEKQMLLALMGTVYDVTKGARNYQKGAAYHYFVGKDGSKAFVTGDFSDESKNKDDIMTLSCKEIFTLVNWQTTLANKYDVVGVLEGRYYDKNGKETPYMKELFHRLESCHEEKEADQEFDRKYPPCNIAWNSDEGSKVWCTKTSGGIARDWVGVPRQLYTPGREPQCVCVNIANISSSNKFKQYEDCAATSTVCSVNTK